MRKLYIHRDNFDYLFSQVLLGFAIALWIRFQRRKFLNPRDNQLFVANIVVLYIKTNNQQPTTNNRLDLD